MSVRPSYHSLSISRTARYATLGSPSEATTWWIVLHGYGQLAGDFIENFHPLVSEETCVIAPEALSRFYVDDLSTHEQVGASWMTRVEREDEIRDYVSYLDAAVEDVGPAPSAVQVLGFSQGAATASRWTALGHVSVDRLVLWGGGLPPDLDLNAHADTFHSLDLTLVLGTNDPYVTMEARDALERRLDAHDIHAHSITYEGGHHIDPTVLREVTAT